MSVQLYGRRVVVTGASSGIGKATARAIVDAGGRVALLARRGEILEEIASDLGASAAVAEADVTDPTAVAGAVARAAEMLGGLDGLVNVAGLNRASRFQDSGPEDWREMLETNIFGAFVAAQAVTPHLLSAGAGDIVNVGSVSSRGDASGYSSVYAATKSALSTWSESLSTELEGQGVRVMLVLPGTVRTDLAQKTRDPELRRVRARRFLEQGLAPVDVANQVVHMLMQPRTVRVSEIVIRPVIAQPPKRP